MSDSIDIGAADEPVVRLRRQALDWLPVDDEVVVLDGVRDLYMGVNNSWSVLFERLAGGATRSELAELLVARFHIEYGGAVNDVEAFLEHLAAERLLKRREETQSLEGGGRRPLRPNRAVYGSA
jgi:hypothetical protein